MALSIIPVVVPFRVHGGTEAALPSVAVEAVASDAKPALTIAGLAASTLASIDYRSRLEQVYRNQARVLPARDAIAGPYLYVFGHSHFVQTVALPRRLDGEGARILDETLHGLRQGRARGLVMDCAMLDYLHSAGIGALIDHLRHLAITIFRPRPNIRKILELVGLTEYFTPHPDLAAALQDLTAAVVRRERDAATG